MSLAFLHRLTISSTLGDLPAHRAALRVADRGKLAGELFAGDAGLPGILLGDDGRFKTAVSRRYYLDAIGRYCGMDLYHPRPLAFMMARYQELGGPLVVPLSTPIAEAVRLGLDRPRELIYEPLVVAEDARPLPPLESVRLVDFEDLLAAGSRLTALRAEQMRHILASVREGLLLVDREQRIAPEYSDSVDRLLDATGLAGLRFPDVLARSVDPSVAEVAGSFVETLFNPRVIENLVEQINPLRRIEIATATGCRVLSFGFTRRMRRGAIEGVLVRIEDVTREDTLARELEHERQRAEEQLRLGLALVQIEPEALTELLRRLRRSREILRSALAAGAVSDPAGLRRDLHALKGDAGLLGLQPVAAALHALESRLSPGGNPAADREGLAASADHLSRLLESIDGLRRRFAGLRSAVAEDDRPPTLPRPAEGDDGLDAFLAHAQRFTDQLARELGKSARFVHRVVVAALDSSHAEVLRAILAQLIRNSLVHGVEGASERSQSGKPSMATLQLVARATGRLVEIVFQDDGRGLSDDKLRERARAHGAPSGEDLHASVFLPGVSTAEQVDVNAGRGIGLDFVAGRVREAGGKIEVHSVAGRYCAFRVLLPGRTS